MNLSFPKFLAFATAIAAILISTFVFVAAPSQNYNYCNSKEHIFSKISQDSRYIITGPLSIEEIELKHTYEIGKSKEKVIFGYGHDEWIKLKAAKLPDDKLYFMSFKEGKFYVDGHILVHNGCVTEFLIDSIS